MPPTTNQRALTQRLSYGDLFCRDMFYRDWRRWMLEKVVYGAVFNLVGALHPKENGKASCFSAGELELKGLRAVLMLLEASKVLSVERKVPVVPPTLMPALGVTPASIQTRWMRLKLMRALQLKLLPERCLRRSTYREVTRGIRTGQWAPNLVWLVVDPVVRAIPRPLLRLLV